MGQANGNSKSRANSCRQNTNGEFDVDDPTVRLVRNSSPEHGASISLNDKQTNAKKLGKPFLKWAGGKSSLLPQLLSNIPADFHRYHEPFLGGGALFFALSPSLATLCDSNEELINCYQIVRRNPEGLITDLSKHHYELKYFLKVRGADRLESFKYWSPLQRASRLIFLNKACFNGLYRLNSKGQFNVPFGRYANPNILDEPRIRDCSKRLQNVKIECRDFKTALLQVKESDFVYLDPPYLPLSQSSSFASYTKEGFGVTEHRELAACCQDLNKRGVRFLLSNSNTDLTRELYQTFSIQEVSAPRMINSKSARRGKISEVLIRNF
jgi:DNA adenine methylase